MIYIIDGKYYVNISPSIYVEVTVDETGKITPTKNKKEVNSNTILTKVTIEEIKNIKKNNINKETIKNDLSIKSKYSKHKR